MDYFFKLSLLTLLSDPINSNFEALVTINISVLSSAHILQIFSRSFSRKFSKKNTTAHYTRSHQREITVISLYLVE